AATIDDCRAAWQRMEGYVVALWSDEQGRPLTLYGRYASQKPTGQNVPKLLALRGGSKASPFCFDRARRVGHREIVLVDGLLDAALLQVRGDTRVVACVAAELPHGQVQTLARCGVQKVTLCLDPDSAGESGIGSCVRSLEAAGIPSYVAPTLPDGLDPDEFVIRDGIDAWRTHVDAAVHAFRYQARRLLRQHGPEEGTWSDRQKAALLAAAVRF